jgi:hypothetical protein
MLKHATQRNIPHKSSVVKTGHAATQKQRGAIGRLPQRRGQDISSLASQRKKNPVRKPKQQTDDNVNDRNVVSISDLRRILRLAEPTENDVKQPTSKTSTQEKRHNEPRTRVIPTPRKAHVTEKEPDVSQGHVIENESDVKRKQTESSSQIVKKSSTALSSDGIFFPFGSPGGGAPIRTKSGQLNAVWHGIY